ncbi:histidine ammonia-lyase [Kamptonema cortianum]|nr:histidine ammonia-lyase [Geitlerinema splendidum]MDK3160918.1 histidine ammonia-lyase [Kamptonema cortianum]
MLILDGNPLTLQEIEDVALGDRVELSPAARDRINAARAVVEKIVSTKQVVYGINTGFGKLSDVIVRPDQLGQLQLNLVRSHACGVGEPLSEPEVRAMLLLRANVLAAGYSGARLTTAETLLQLLNHSIHPVVPEQGSVGASGDLAPLAHLALTLIGEGECFYEGLRMPSLQALKKAGIQPVTLEAKEGLALLNGTQAMGSVGGLALAKARKVLLAADIVGAMSLDALRGTTSAFDARIHAARPHQGQRSCAARLNWLLEGSEIRESHLVNDPRVQDAYSLRCMPQVHGAVSDALDHVSGIVEIESGSGTDNPLVFTDTSEVISGGNFHGAPLAMAFDYAAIAMTDLGSISERRIERLVNPDLSEGLPAFLAREPGISSGFMIPQVTAAALLNECKTYAHPASVDNVPTSAGKEDHVSMGMVAATKLRRIVQNVQYILAIELIAACEGLDFHAPLKTSPALLAVYESVRDIVPAVVEDRALGKDIEAVAELILKLSN